MNLTDKLSNLANLGREAAQQQRDSLISDAEQRFQKIANDLAARIERALFIAAGLVTAGLIAVAVTAIAHR